MSAETTNIAIGDALNLIGEYTASVREKYESLQNSKRKLTTYTLLSLFLGLLFVIFLIFFWTKELAGNRNPVEEPLSLIGIIIPGLIIGVSVAYQLILGRRRIDSTSWDLAISRNQLVRLNGYISQYVEHNQYDGFTRLTIELRLAEAEEIISRTRGVSSRSRKENTERKQSSEAFENKIEFSNSGSGN